MCVVDERLTSEKIVQLTCQRLLGDDSAAASRHDVIVALFQAHIPLAVWGTTTEQLPVTRTVYGPYSTVSCPAAPWP